MSVPEPRTTGNRVVMDSRGHNYRLTGKIGEGGQGVVCRTDHPRVLAKIPRSLTVADQNAWKEKITRLMRQPWDFPEKLNLAFPLALIEKPQPGYIMELMDGLIPLSELLNGFLEKGLADFIATGGLRRRYRILAALARTLAALNGRGLSYGDLSPANVFVSADPAYAEVWLIDTDNISSLAHPSDHPVYTPDFGPPEVLRGEALASSLTDAWSFAVIAWMLLTHGHPLKGDAVSNGEPECEDQALRGEWPWVGHPTDERNRAVAGIPAELVLTPKLTELFQAAFTDGIVEPGARPTAMAWAEAFTDAIDLLARCECGSYGLYADGTKTHCDFCDRAAPAIVVLNHYDYHEIPEIKDPKPEEQWCHSGRRLVIGAEPVDLRLAPDMPNSPIIATIVRQNDGRLRIEPSGNAELHIRDNAGNDAIATKNRPIPPKNPPRQLWLIPSAHHAWGVIL